MSDHGVGPLRPRDGNQVAGNRFGAGHRAIFLANGELDGTAKEAAFPIDEIDRMPGGCADVETIWLMRAARGRDHFKPDSGGLGHSGAVRPRPRQPDPEGCGRE